MKWMMLIVVMCGVLCIRSNAADPLPAVRWEYATMLYGENIQFASKSLFTIEKNDAAGRAKFYKTLGGNGLPIRNGNPQFSNASFGPDEFLNALGDAGWELIYRTGRGQADGEWTFKRRAQ